jgi:hypothetical protein
VNYLAPMVGILDFPKDFIMDIRLVRLHGLVAQGFLLWGCLEYLLQEKVD